jgi:sensor histidine kinase YesM
MHNVDQRIKLRYGEQYGLTVASARGEGTVVSILFPIIHERTEEHEQ